MIVLCRTGLSGWATTAEDPTRYHSFPVQIGKRGYNLQELTKIGQLKISVETFRW